MLRVVARTIDMLRFSAQNGIPEQHKQLLRAVSAPDSDAQFTVPAAVDHGGYYRSAP